ncbi:MAG TPA: hypothetical protein VGB02_16345 [Pyrinomonadaceae bacterium]|jgi:hypothetical protein
MPEENIYNPTLVELAQRKRIELEQKALALENELNQWFTKSEAKGRFEKHHTQIRAVRALLAPWHVLVSEKLSQYTEQEDPEVFLGKCANAEKLILSEHRIWDFFRGKFVQRSDDTFNRFLKIADEFAWACYEPVQKAVFPDETNARRKEPPLVFFNGSVSPFSLSRDRAFQPEIVAGETINLDSDTVGKLPIPVIGVPWHQINYLPEALVIGHEVGHIIENDFGLTKSLRQHLSDALDNAGANERKDAWLCWLSEIFADLYGCLSSGAAFAGTLIDFLIKKNETISSEQKNAANWGRYPTDYLRIRIVLRALEELRFNDEITNYRTLWASYSSNMPEGFTNDIEHIVPALLNGKHQTLRNKSVLQIFSFSKRQQSDAVRTVGTLRSTNADTYFEMPTRDIRVLLAALRMAFEESPARYANDGYGKTVLEHMETKVLLPGTRNGEPVLSAKQLENKSKSYQQTGDDLLKTLNL